MGARVGAALGGGRGGRGCTCSGAGRPAGEGSRCARGGRAGGHPGVDGGAQSHPPESSATARFRGGRDGSAGQGAGTGFGVRAASLGRSRVPGAAPPLSAAGRGFRSAEGSLSVNLNGGRGKGETYVFMCFVRRITPSSALRLPRWGRRQDWRLLIAFFLYVRSLGVARLGVCFLSNRAAAWQREAGAQRDASPCLSRGRPDTRVRLPQPCPGVGIQLLPSGPSRAALEVDRLGTPLYFSDGQHHLPPPPPVAGTACCSSGRRWGCPRLGRHGSHLEMGPFVFSSELPGVSG